MKQLTFLLLLLLAFASCDKSQCTAGGFTGMHAIKVEYTVVYYVGTTDRDTIVQEIYLKTIRCHDNVEQWQLDYYANNPTIPGLQWYTLEFRP